MPDDRFDPTVKATAIPMVPGDVVFFVNPLLHAVTENVSQTKRIMLYLCYSYRWVKPMDYRFGAHGLEGLPPVAQYLMGGQSDPCDDWFATGRSPIADYLDHRSV